MEEHSMKSMEHKNIDVKKGEIVIYKAKNGTVRLDVKLEKETVWLTQKQLAELFLTERSVITKHLNNIFQTGELDEKRNVQKMHIPFSDKPVSLYNLDVIISVGYRVNSKRATQFRIWATGILKNYVTKGYALNQKRLHEHKTALKGLRETIAFIEAKASHPQLVGKADGLLKLLNEYANTLTILYEYDNKSISLAGKARPSFVFEYDLAVKLINDIAARLTEKGEAGNLFGREMGHRFKGIIGALYQTFDKKDLYVSVEEKAAHLLYLTIKDHPFSDGNKRIASIMFLYFLEKNGYLYKANGERKITDNTMVALSLLIAASDPKEKDIMIKIITNLLK